MAEVTIRHRTAYLYRQPVWLGPHRLMLRPRESRDVRLVSAELTVSPEAKIAWAHDVAGNAVATARFEGSTETLSIDSVAHVKLAAAAYPVFDIAASAITFPFRYSDDEWTDLGSLGVQQYADQHTLRSWAQGFVAGATTDTLSLLRDLNAGTSRALIYEAREDGGTQSPTMSLTRGRGSCRDIATLFIEAARSLGFGARAVSGYLHDPTRSLLGSADGGSTHAWAEIYIPGAGWITFDPTNQSVGGANLIPVAVGRDIRLALPITGTFAGSADALREMSVQVCVNAL